MTLMINPNRHTRLEEENILQKFCARQDHISNNMYRSPTHGFSISQTTLMALLRNGYATDDDIQVYVDRMEALTNG